VSGIVWGIYRSKSRNYTKQKLNGLDTSCRCD
jgi:hypothetical protein